MSIQDHIEYIQEASLCSQVPSPRLAHSILRVVGHVGELEARVDREMFLRNEAVQNMTRDAGRLAAAMAKPPVEHIEFLKSRIAELEAKLKCDECGTELTCQRCWYVSEHDD
jgi:hypothetical protein